MKKKKIKQIVYYAHSMQIYDTVREMFELDFLKEKYIVVCPNNDLGELGSMKLYLEALAKTDMVVASAYRGFVGRGVFEEIRHGLKLGMPVYQITLDGNDEEYYLSEIAGVGPVRPRDMKIRYGRIILK